MQTCTKHVNMVSRQMALIILVEQQPSPQHQARFPKCKLFMADEHVWTNLLTPFEKKNIYIKHFISETTLETG